jgi:hypothetical protein
VPTAKPSTGRAVTDPRGPLAARRRPPEVRPCAVVRSSSLPCSARSPSPPLGNAPYTIEGDPVAEHLSFRYRSAYAFDGEVCDDVRAGCP